MVAFILDILLAASVLVISLFGFRVDWRQYERRRSKGKDSRYKPWHYQRAGVGGNVRRVFQLVPSGNSSLK